MLLSVDSRRCPWAPIGLRALWVMAVVWFLLQPAAVADPLQIETELTADEAEWILDNNPELVEHVFNEYRYFSQCSEILFWDDEGHYTQAKYMKLASIPGIIYGSFQAFSWMMSNGGRVLNGQLPALLVGRDAAVVVPATPPRSRIAKIAGVFKRYRVARGALALTIGVYFFMHANAIADGDKYEIVAGSVQDYFRGLRGATELALRNTARADVMTKGSLKAVSLELAKLSCGDEQPSMKRSSTHGDFFNTNSEVPLPDSDVETASEENVVYKENYQLTVAQADAELKANRAYYIDVKNKLRELSACEEIWVVDPQSGEALQAKYWWGTYLVGTSLGSVAGYLLLTKTEASRLRSQRYDPKIKQKWFSVVRDGEKIKFPKGQLFARVGLSTVGSSFIFLNISTFLVPIVAEVLGDKSEEIVLLDASLQEQFNALEGISEVAMRNAILEQVRRTGSLTAFNSELDLYHLSRPE